MNLAVATFISALTLLLLSVSLLFFPRSMENGLKQFPRSRRCAVICFGSALVWFLVKIWGLSPADFGAERLPIFVCSGAVGLLAFKFAPDFLALRGLCALMLLAAAPLLRAGFMKYDLPGVYFQTGLVYLGITLALIVAGQPCRWRDTVGWLFAKQIRTRGLGSALLIYSILLDVIGSLAARQNL